MFAQKQCYYTVRSYMGLPNHVNWISHDMWSFPVDSCSSRVMTFSDGCSGFLPHDGMAFHITIPDDLAQWYVDFVDFALLRLFTLNLILQRENCSYTESELNYQLSVNPSVPKKMPLRFYLSRWWSVMWTVWRCQNHEKILSNGPKILLRGTPAFLG